MSFEALQAHSLSRLQELALPPRAKDLQRELRGLLRRASDAGKLRTPPYEILQLVEVLAEPPASLADQLRERDLLASASCIVGGDKDLARDRSRRHFTRDDDAWFDFTITVRQGDHALELLAYDFEIRFLPGSISGTPFLRFDLNLPSHRNDQRELRAHVHAGSDDILLPGPLLTPVEALALFVDGLRLPAQRDKPRTASEFERNWFRDVHVALSRRP